MSAGLNLILVGSAALFAIGAAGLIVKRNVIVMLIGTQLMLAAGGMAFVAFGRFDGRTGSGGASMALFVSALGVAELAVGLAMASLLYREHRSLLVDEYE